MFKFSFFFFKFEINLQVFSHKVLTFQAQEILSLKSSESFFRKFRKCLNLISNASVLHSKFSTFAAENLVFYKI